MKLIYDVTEGSAKEILEFNGKRYERDWNCKDGRWFTNDDGFSEQLESDGYSDDELLDKVYDVVDSNFNIIDCKQIAEFEEG